MGLFFAYILFAVNDPNDGLNDEWWLPAAIFMMLAVFVWAFLDASIRQIRWDQRGIKYTKLGRKERFVSWSEVKSLEYKALLQYWRLEFADGSGLAVSEIMRGSQAFLDEVKDRADLEV